MRVNAGEAKLGRKIRHEGVGDCGFGPGGVGKRWGCIGLFFLKRKKGQGRRGGPGGKTKKKAKSCCNEGEVVQGSWFPKRSPSFDRGGKWWRNEKKKLKKKDRGVLQLNKTSNVRVPLLPE